MKPAAASAAGAILLAVSLPVRALPATFSISQIDSNADGSVQFIVVYDQGRFDCDAGEHRWAGQVLTSVGGGTQKTFTFPSNLPNCATSDRSILIASQGFTALGILAPDYYRVFSNRRDANHRYVTDPNDRALMVSRGWLAEGVGADMVVMCAQR